MQIFLMPYNKLSDVFRVREPDPKKSGLDMFFSEQNIDLGKILEWVFEIWVCAPFLNGLLQKAAKQLSRV